MRELPILFSGPMVREILAGRKTMTRRVVKWPEWLPDHDTGAYWLNRHPCAALHNDGRAVKRMCCPYGVPGDLLWVRETWGTVRMHELGQHVFRDGPIPDHDKIVYRAGRRGYKSSDAPPGAPFSEWPVSWSDDPVPDGGRWKPSIHMPRWASRLTLHVTDVRVERVQDITEEDVVAEGVDPPRCPACGYSYSDARLHADHSLCGRPSPGSAIPKFQYLWDTLNAKRGHGWDVNPWVWVVSFERAAPTEEEKL